MEFLLVMLVVLEFYKLSELKKIKEEIKSLNDKNGTVLNMLPDDIVDKESTVDIRDLCYDELGNLHTRID